MRDRLPWLCKKATDISAYIKTSRTNEGMREAGSNKKQTCYLFAVVVVVVAAVAGGWVMYYMPGLSVLS